MNTNNVLFLGNGINNVYNGKDESWESLLKKLCEKYNVDYQITKVLPLPLLFEHIISFNFRKNDKVEIEAKQFIADYLMKFYPENLHKLIASLDFNNIITSNYDLTIEKAMSKNSKFHNLGEIKETHYNLFRRYEIGNTTIWHMHGTILNRNSITLGFEHYSSYLRMMQEYLLFGNNYKNKIDGVKTKLNNNTLVKTTSWIDLFFTHDIYILGLSLDFSEFPLWYLINKRFKMKNGAFKNKIKNKIFYFYSKYDFNDIENSKPRNNSEQNKKSKIDFLESFDVTTIPIKDFYKNESYYETCLNKINNIKG